MYFVYCIRYGSFERQAVWGLNSYSDNKIKESVPYSIERRTDATVTIKS